MTLKPEHQKILQHLKVEKCTSIAKVAKILDSTMYKAKKEVGLLKASGRMVYRTSYGWFESEETFREWLYENRNDQEEKMLQRAIGKSRSRENYVFEECRNSETMQRIMSLFSLGK